MSLLPLPDLYRNVDGQAAFHLALFEKAVQPLAGGSSLEGIIIIGKGGRALRFYSLTLLPAYSLLPEYKSDVTSKPPAPVTRSHVFSAMTGYFLVEL